MGSANGNYKNGLSRCKSAAGKAYRAQKRREQRAKQARLN